MAGMTRREVARRLGVSVATVRRMEGEELHPTVGLDSVRRFAQAEVDAVATARSTAASASMAATAPVMPARPVPSPVAGEVAAVVFADFDEGRSPSAIVVARQLPPEVVRRLHADWLDLRALDVNAPSGGQRLAAVEKKLADLHAYAVRTVEAFNALAARVAALPVPPTTEFACDCGAAGLVTVPVTCSACGVRTDWGTRPD